MTVDFRTLLQRLDTPTHKLLPDKCHSPQKWEEKVDDSLTYSFTQVTLRKGKSIYSIILKLRSRHLR